MNNIKKSAKKWYDFLAFPKEFDALFDKILKREDISDEILSKSYTELNDAGDYEINLIYSLAKCDDLKLKYKQASINDQIFADTIADIKVRSLICYEYTNILGIDLILWIANHLDLKLFKLGRLQFNFSPSIVDCPEAGLKEGDNTIGVHIPKDEPFTPELWEKSFSMANEFFAKHFPEYEYKYFSCSSWFLSPDLDILLNEGSNILKFKPFSPYSLRNIYHILILSYRDCDFKHFKGVENMSLISICRLQTTEKFGIIIIYFCKG